jgi:hypothetical protein
MLSGRTILSYLEKLDVYLGQFAHKRSTYFEHLISLAFSQALYLPFYTIDNDDQSVGQRVTWQGSDKGGCLSLSPPGKPDIIAYCYGFYLIVEATQKTGAMQWTDEFAQAVRHCDDFVKANNVQPSQVYILLVTPKLHDDTYNSLRHHPLTAFKFVPLETDVLDKILNTSLLALTIRHLDLRRFFNRVGEYIKKSSTLREFREGCEEGIIIWQKEVLKQEKDAFIGIKSYEAMRKAKRAAVSVSEIFENLLEDSFVKEYLNVLGETLDVGEIETSLKAQSLCCCAGKTIQTDEALLECVPWTDFKGRGLRLIEAVENIDR